jgi:predicted oxidoreductase
MGSHLVSGAPRLLGDAGPAGPVGLGIWRMTGGSTDDHVALLRTAVDLGVTLVDTADVYGLDWGGAGFGTCEEALGRALRAAPGLRDRVLIVAKVGIVPGVPYNSSAAHLVAACEASLDRMGIDHADVLLVHRPDPFTHPDEVASAFSTLHQRGLVREFGASNYLPSQVAALQHAVTRPLVAVQPRFSCAHPEPLWDGTLDQCATERLVPMAWSALDGGRIATGEGIRPELLQVLDDLAVRESSSRAAVAVAFVLAHPASPIALVGTRRAERLADVCAATGVRLDRADAYRIIEASTGTPLP